MFDVKFVSIYRLYSMVVCMCGLQWPAWVSQCKCNSIQNEYIQWFTKSRDCMIVCVLFNILLSLHRKLFNVVIAAYSSSFPQQFVLFPNWNVFFSNDLLRQQFNGHTNQMKSISLNHVFEKKISDRQINCKGVCAYMRRFSCAPYAHIMLMSFENETKPLDSKIDLILCGWRFSYK